MHEWIHMLCCCCFSQMSLCIFYVQGCSLAVWPLLASLACIFTLMNCSWCYSTPLHFIALGNDSTSSHSKSRNLIDCLLQIKSIFHVYFSSHLTASCMTVLSFCMHIKIKPEHVQGEPSLCQSIDLSGFGEAFKADQSWISYDRGKGTRLQNQACRMVGAAWTIFKFHFHIVYFAGYSFLSRKNMPAPGVSESVPTSWRLWAWEKGEISGKVKRKWETTSLGWEEGGIEVENGRIKVTFHWGLWSFWGIMRIWLCFQCISGALMIIANIRIDRNYMLCTKCQTMANDKADMVALIYPSLLSVLV